jgi:phosphopantothenoylcysteine decarboxylase/phosphopantothenate--cysteine ligase
MLEGVNVALGVSGSIAAVKVVELAHELRRHGAVVRGVMTPAAQGIIHPWALEFATEHDVVTEITGRVEHVELCGREGWADVLLLAPATANTVGKVASAVDDTPVTTCATTALGAGLPVVCAPAMHEPMYDHPGVVDALDRLTEWGVSFVDPRVQEGKAKVATEQAVVTGVARAASPKPLAGERVVVTAGATVEPVDPVRLLTNRSSGRMGRALARACHVHGADVTLVHGTGSTKPEVDAHYADVEWVETSEEMLTATLDACADADALASAAAISDFTVDVEAEKIRSGEARTLELKPTPKLIDSVRESYPDLAIVGFKTETSGDDEAMIAAAREVRDRAGLAFVVANDASVMGSEETRALVVTEESTAPDAFTGSKQALSARLVEELACVLADGPAS